MDFGAGMSSIKRNPTHLYSLTETFPVKLTVAGPGATSSSTTRTVTVTPAVRRPDLVVTSFNGPDYGVRGRTVPVDATLRNQGSLSASGFFVRYCRSADATIIAADHLLYPSYVSLPRAGASSTTRTHVTVPTMVARGSKYLGAFIDPISRVLESNDGNNIRVDS